MGGDGGWANGAKGQQVRDGRGRCGVCFFFFFLMIRRPPGSTQGGSSAASDVYKRRDQKIANVVFATQLVVVLVRNWVIAIATERVTSPQTAHREPAAFEGAMLFQSF